MSKRMMMSVLTILVVAGTAWAAAPSVPVPTAGPGLYHEFNDLHATHGVDYSTTATDYYTWNTPGVLTHLSGLSGDALLFYTGDRHHVQADLRSNRDWLAKFRMQKNGDVYIGKVIEMDGRSGPVLQVGFSAGGRLDLTYGPYGLVDPCEYPMWIGYNVFEPNIMHDLVVAYDKDTELLDVYVDDALVLGGVECKGSASGSCGDLYSARMRGTCDYDELIIYQRPKMPPRAKNPSLDGSIGLWQEFNSHVPTYGVWSKFSSAWSWPVPGIGYNPSIDSGLSGQWKTIKDGEGIQAMPTDEDWVVQVTTARNSDTLTAKWIEIEGPTSQGIQLDLWTEETIQIGYGEGTGPSAYTYHLCPRNGFGYDPADPCDYRTLAVHYKANVSAIDVWIDNLLVIENVQTRYIPPDVPGYAINGITCRGISFFDEIIIGPYDAQPPEECGDSGTVYTAGDVNKDCYTDLTDFGLVAADWLQCTDAADSACDEFWTQVEFGAPIPVIDSTPGLWVDFNEPNDPWDINYGKLGVNPHGDGWYISTDWNYSNGGPGDGPGIEGAGVSVPHSGWTDDNLYYIAQASDDPNDPNAHTSFDGSGPWAIQLMLKLQPDEALNAGPIMFGANSESPLVDTDPCAFLFFLTNGQDKMLDHLLILQGNGTGEWTTGVTYCDCSWYEWHKVTIVYDPCNVPEDPNKGYIDVWVDDIKEVANLRSRNDQYDLGNVLIGCEVAYDDLKVSGNLAQGPFSCGEFGTVYKTGDLDTDCDVDIDDLRVLIGPWLDCTDPADPNCYTY